LVLPWPWEWSCPRTTTAAMAITWFYYPTPMLCQQHSWWCFLPQNSSTNARPNILTHESFVPKWHGHDVCSSGFGSNYSTSHWFNNFRCNSFRPVSRFERSHCHGRWHWL
jgi:hypothetical protein